MRGYSRSTVAELAGMSEKHLYNIEMGNVRMSVDTLIDLCEIYLDCICISILSTAVTKM